MEDIDLKLKELDYKRAEREETRKHEFVKVGEVDRRCRQVLSYAKKWVKKSYLDFSPFVNDRKIEDLKDLKKFLEEEIIYIEEAIQGMMHYSKDWVYDIIPEIPELHKLYKEIECEYNRIRPTEPQHTPPKAKQPQTSTVETPKAQPKPPKEDTPNVEVQKDVTTPPFYDLTSYIDGSTESIEYMMKYKQPRDGVQLLWKSAKGDAQLFRIILNWDLPSINKCIRFKNGKPLAHGDKLSKRGGNPYLRKILQGLK